MTPEENKKFKYHLQEISKLLYADTPSEQLTGLKRKTSKIML